MKKILISLFFCMGTINCVSLYADALDDLVNQKQAEKMEQKEQEEKLKQQKEENEKEYAQLFENIADCAQAFKKSLERQFEIVEEGKIYKFDNEPYINKDNFFTTENKNIRVVDFASDGVFLSNDIFVYTEDTDYATNELFRHNNVLYKKVGNYRYTTVNGGTRAIVAVKASSHKTSEINPQTYLKNKNLVCCQCYDDAKTVGIIVEGGDCRTAQKPNEPCRSLEEQKAIREAVTNFGQTLYKLKHMFP